MNLVKAADKALQMNMKLYSLVGKDGGELSKISHEFIKVASYETSIIQEAHIAVIHAICLVIDNLALKGLS
jgi:D-sedoheptulose 7-phosphate isomerase